MYEKEKDKKNGNAYIDNICISQNGSGKVSVYGRRGRQTYFKTSLLYLSKSWNFIFEVHVSKQASNTTLALLWSGLAEMLG